MPVTSPRSPVDPDAALRRARQLRSEAALSALAWLRRTASAAIARAFLRPYRMAWTRRCGGEA